MGEVRRLPSERAMFVDGRDRGLRATWHHDHGVVVLSMWREDRCVETVRLGPADAARLVAVLTAGLADLAERAGADVDEGGERVAGGS